MSKKILKISGILGMLMMSYQTTALADTSMFLGAGLTKTSESNYNILEIHLNDPENITYNSANKPKINNNFETGTYFGGFSYTNKNRIKTKAKFKHTSQNYRFNLTSPGTNADYLKATDFFAASEANDISIKLKDRVAVADLSVGKDFTVLEKLEADVSIGLRYASIKRKQERILEGGGDFGTVEEGTHGTSMITEEFSGYGVRFGTEGKYEFVGGFGIFAEGGLALLSGEKETNKNQTERLENTREDLRTKSNAIVVSTDISAGLDWKIRHFAFAVGYEMENWNNALAHFYNDSDAPVGVDHNFSTDMFFLRVALEF